MMLTMVITAEELRDAREVHTDMTQRDLAELLGVSPRTIVNWEANGVPSKREARVLAKFGREIQFTREGRAAMAAHDEWMDSPEGRAHLEARGAEYAEAALREEDPIGYGLTNASDEQLLTELRRRLASGRSALSQADVALAAHDDFPGEDQRAEVESYMDEA